MLVCGEGMVPSGLSFGGWQAFVFQPQNFARARHVAVLVRFGMARGVHNVKINGVGFQRQVTGLSQTCRKTKPMPPLAGRKTMVF